MKFLEMSWPFILMGLCMLFGAYACYRKHINKQKMIIPARVLNAECNFEPGTYKSRAFAYTLTVEYIKNGTYVQADVQSFEHFPVNSTIDILPLSNRIEVITKTPLGRVVNFRFDKLFFILGLFVVHSGITVGLSALQLHPMIVEAWTCVPLVATSIGCSWYSYKEKRKIKKYQNSPKTKVVSTIVEHSIERRLEKSDRIHVINNYEYNGLAYVYDYIVYMPPAPRLYSKVELEVDPKTGFVINPRQTVENAKFGTIASLIFWGLTLITIAVSFLRVI